MTRIFIAVVFLMAAFAQFGCGGAGSNVAPADANANSAAVSEFAYITDPNAALAEGNRLLDNNQTEKAIEAYRRAVELNPDLAEAHFQLGIAYALIESEMQQSGANVEATANTGEKKAGQPKPNSQKAFEKAVEAYKKLIAANAKDDVSQFNLGRAYNKLNKDEEAEDAFKNAVKLKPEDTEYQTEYGAILVKLAKYREALGPLKKAIEIDAENSRAANLLEDAEAGAKRIDFAQKDDDKKPDSNTANANMAANSNSPVGSANSNTKTAKEEPKEKRPERPTPKPKP